MPLRGASLVRQRLVSCAGYMAASKDDGVEISGHDRESTNRLPCSLYRRLRGDSWGASAKMGPTFEAVGANACCSGGDCSKQPNDAVCAGYVVFRIMYIMFKATGRSRCNPVCRPQRPRHHQARHCQPPSRHIRRKRQIQSPQRGSAAHPCINARAPAAGHALCTRSTLNSERHPAPQSCRFQQLPDAFRP